MIIIVSVCGLTAAEDVDVPHERLEDMIQFLQGWFLGTCYVHQQKYVLLLETDGAVEVIEYEIDGHA